jgi:hypothetical protein
MVVSGSPPPLAVNLTTSKAGAGRERLGEGFFGGSASGSDYGWRAICENAIAIVPSNLFAGLVKISAEIVAIADTGKSLAVNRQDFNLESGLGNGNGIHGRLVGVGRLTAAQSPRPAQLTRKSVNFICVIQREKLDRQARLTARKGGTAGKFFRQVYFRRMILFC